jgi:hypothetical protein
MGISTNSPGERREQEEVRMKYGPETLIPLILIVLPKHATPF